MSYSNYQLELLNRMGVDVWTLKESTIEPRVETEQWTEDLSTSGSQVDSHDEVSASQPASHTPIDTQPVSRSSSASETAIEESIEKSTPIDSEPLVPSVTLAQLSVVVKECQRCVLHETRSNTVFGNGNGQSDWMFVGEAPGQQEDKEGNPFVGRAGQLLNMMISALGIKREDVYVANVLKCRPPNNRDPLPDEVEECEQYLLAQLDIVKPKVIVALGRISAQALLKTGLPLGKMRGTTHYYGENKTPLIATYHPAYLLRSPDQKGKSWEDLWLAKEVVEQS